MPQWERSEPECNGFPISNSRSSSLASPNAVIKVNIDHTKRTSGAEDFRAERSDGPEKLNWRGQLAGRLRQAGRQEAEASRK